MTRTDIHDKYEGTEVEMTVFDLLTGNIPGYRDDMTAEEFDALLQDALKPQKHVSAVSLARDIFDLTEKMGKEKRQARFVQYTNVQMRTDAMNKNVESLLKKGYSRSEAQHMSLCLLEAFHIEGTGNKWMADFTEKLREQLVDRLSAFGHSAYALTDKQFEAAVKAAW